MCVLYVSFGSKVRHITFGCVVMDSAVLCILRSRLPVYSAGSGVNRVQVVLSGFSIRLFCFVLAKTCRYGCCCRPHPFTDNGGEVQHPSLRTPADGIPPCSRHPDPLAD